MKIDINKKYRTREGRGVIIHCTDGPRDGFPVIASIESPGATGGWIARDFTESGKHLLAELDGYDLIEVREPMEWTLAVSVGHGNYKAGELSSSRTQSQEFSEFWIPVRVREIID